MNALQGTASMEYWEDVLAAAARLDTPYRGGAVGRGWQFNKLFGITLEYGVPVRALEIGDGGAGNVEFADPQRVYNDITDGRLNPFTLGQRGVFGVEEFAARLLMTRSPETFYVAPLVYFRPTEMLPLPAPVTRGLTEWQAFRHRLGVPLEAGHGDGPWLETPFLQRIFSIAWRNGEALQVAEVPAGDGGTLWEPPQEIWEDMAFGRIYPTAYVDELYRERPLALLRLFIHKDASHIGYEFAIR